MARHWSLSGSVPHGVDFRTEPYSVQPLPYGV